MRWKCTQYKGDAISTLIGKQNGFIGGVNRNRGQIVWRTIWTDGKNGPTIRRRCDAKRWVECAAACMSQAPRIEKAIVQL